ncbi:uncharacterized protein LOC124805807 isoform X6 [Hydra vulgaris]
MSISLKLNIGDSVVIVSRGTESYIVKMQSGFFGILVNEGGSTPGISSMLTAPIVNYGGSWLTIPIPIPTSGYGQFQTPSNSVKSNGRFSFTQTQIFIISAIINVQTSSSSLSLILSLQNDPSTFSNQRTGLFTTNLRTSKNSSYSIAGILELQAGQPLFIYLYLTSPGTYSIQPGSRVCVAAVQQEYESFNVVLPSSVYQTKSNDWVVVDTWSESQKSDSFVFTEKLVSGKYTAMATGIYYLSANVIFKDSNGPIYIMIAVNNQLSKRTALYATKGKPSVVQDSLSVSGALFIKKDSYVNVYVMIENDNSWSIDIDSTFSMVFLGYQTNIFGVTTVLTNSLAYTTSGWFKIGKWKSQPVAGPFFDFGGGFNPDTGDFVAPKAGFYIVSAGIKMVQASAVGSSFTLNVAVNSNPSTLQYQNGIQDYLQNGNVAPTTNDFYSLVVSGLVLVNVGDSINLYIQSVADPSYTISQDSYVSIVFISSTNNLYSSGMQLMLDPTLDQQQSASDWSKVKYWQNNRVSTATGVFSSGNLLKLDSVMGTVTVQETGIYYIFVNLAIAPDLNNYQIAVYTTLTSMTSLITRFSDKDHSQYTMKVYGALYLYKGQELSIRVKPSAANAQWENLRSYSGWSFVRIPPYLPIPSVGAGKPSIDSLPFIKVGYYTRLRNWNVTMSTILGVDGEGLNQRDGVYTVFLDGVYLISSTLVIKTNKSQISIGIKIGINADLSDILVVKSGVGPSYLYPVCSGICTISITQAVQLLVGHTVAIFVQSDALTTYVSELSVISLKLINPLRLLDGFSCQLLSEILISSSGDQKIVGWSAVESIHYTNSTQANEYIISKGGIYLAAFNMDLINIYGFISIKQYLGTSIINLFEYYNEGLLPFSLSSATVVSLNVGDVYSLKINALSDNSYSIGKPSSSSLTFIGDDTYGFSAVQFRINNNFYNQSKWYPINGWITNGSSWLFEYGQGFLSRQDYIVEKSGFYFITANIIFDKAQNENVLEMVVVLNKVDTVLYDQKILSLKSSTTSTVRGGVFLNNLDYLQLLIRLSSNNDNLIIKKESSFSIVRIGFDTLSTTCVDNGPNILGDLSQKNARLNQGENLNLEISATGSNLTYQWLKNFELLKGMTSQVLKLINLKTSDSGSYTCEAIQNAVRVSSSIAKIIVFDPYPVFLNPSSDYNLTAMENGPKIMNLLSISARTQSNESNFEEMFFDIISGNDLQYFQLFPSRSSTGTTLQRTQQLNREKIKSYQLKIRATNALNPNYITVQLIWITVVDENDNSPRFDKTNYNTSVLEGSPIGTVLIQVHAIDPDEGRNSIIVYSILPLDGSKLFSIDQYAGIITLADKLDANVKSAYMIVVKANNLLGSLNSSYAQVFITITNINKFEPYWLQDTYNVDISELLTPDTQILQLLAADEDFGTNALIKYEIVSGNEANLFDVKLTGMLVTKGKLSYDLQNIFLLKIHIQDGGSPPKSAVKNATVTINVLNSKSNNPIFEKSEYITTVMENTSYFDPPFVVKANSLDKKLTIMYSIPPNQNVSEIFDIGILTGIIVLKKPLEFEKATFYKFIVQATAAGANAAANANILVKVLDASNNVPFFVDSYKSINIELKTSVGNIVYRVSAVDKDSGMNGVIGYRIKSGNINDIFEIDSTTGDIRINNSLDTNTEHFTLFIIAFYNGRPSIESIPFILDIYITGVNYYAPAFSSSSFTVTLSDTSISNQFIYQLAAIDPDPGPDGYLKYNIISGNSDGLFYIDATGVVRVKPPSGFQFLSQYQLGITAEDSFKPPKVSSIFTLFVRTTPRIFVDNVQLGSYQFQTTISFKDYAYLKNLFMLQVLVQRYAPYESSFLVDSQLAPTTWYEVNTDVNSPKLIRYIAVEKSFPQIRVRRSVVNTNDSFVVVIGENTTCAAIKTKNLPSICNGPLKSGFAYRMQLRVYEAQNSTPIESTFSSPITIPTREMQYSFLTDGSQSDMVALSSAFGAICFLSFLVILIYVCWKQRHEIVYNEHLKVTNKTESMYDHSDKAFSNPSSSNPDTFYAHGERDSIERSKAYTKNESETTKPPRITLSNDGAFDKYSIDETEPSENLYALAEAMSKKHEQEKLQKVQEKERSKNIENKYKKSTVFDVVTQLELKNGKKVLNENMPHSYEQEVTDNDSSSVEYESISSYGQHVSKPKNKFYEDDGSIAF